MTSYRKSIYFILISLFVFFVARLSLVIIYQPLFSDLGALEIFFGFVEGIRFDLASTIAFFSIPLLIMNFPVVLFQNRIAQMFISWFLFAVLVVGIGFLIGDIIYFGFVKRHLAYELILMGGEDVNDMGELITGVYLPYLILLVILSIGLGFFWNKISKRPFKASRFTRMSVAKYVLFFLLLVIAGRGGLGYKPIAVIDAFASGNTAYSNLVLNGIFSIYRFSFKGTPINHHFFKEEEALSYMGHSPENERYPFQQQRKANQPGRYNLVFVLIESLSYKYVDSFAGNNYGVTKNLDRLSKEGVRFVNFFASGQRSVEGIQATLTGIPPIAGLPTIATGLMAEYSRLGHIAADNGYSTIFVQGPKRRSFRVDAIAGAVGFMEFYGKEDMPLILDYPDPAEGKFGWDYETYMFAAEKMEKAKKPFLTYILTSTTHTPYPRFPDHLEKYPHSYNQESGFLNTVNYTDWSIGEFIKRLKKHSWFKNTIFIFTADHALAHYQGGQFLDRFRIPLIIYAPDILKPNVINKVSGQLNLFPTIIELLDLNATYTSFSNSLFNLEEDSFAIVREGSIMGIIDNHGYLRHSLVKRFETGSFGSELSDEHLAGMEKRLLASDQLTYELLKSNRWAE